MQRNELIQEINKQKAIIIAILEQFNIHFTESKTIDSIRINNHPLMSLIIDSYYKGFYDNKTKEIKQKLKVKNKYYNSDSLTNVMTTIHLEYYLEALKDLTKYLNELSYMENEQEEVLIGKMYYIAKSKREKFKKETKNIPITNLLKNNSLTVLYVMIEEKLSTFDESVTEERLKELIKIESQTLQETLPKKFMDKKAYGTIIGNLNNGFYHLKNYEIEAYLREKDIHYKGNLTELINKEQLKYRYLSLLYIKTYAKRYNYEDFDHFSIRALEIGSILREIYVKNTSKDPLFELGKKKISNLQVENIPQKNINLQKQEEEVFVNQINMFNEIENNKSKK